MAVRLIIFRVATYEALRYFKIVSLSIRFHQTILIQFVQCGNSGVDLDQVGP